MTHRIFFFSLLILAACTDDRALEPSAVQLEAETPQRSGDPVRGRSLLLDNGTPEAPYLSCGVPRGLLDGLKFLGIDVFANSTKLPERERGNADLPYDFSYAKTKRGVEVVTVNCLLCHASKLGDSLVVGLGNANLNLATEGTSFGLPTFALDLLSLALNSDERAEYARFGRINRASNGFARPDTRGMNAADAMFGVLAAHRDADTLEWHDQPDPEARLDVDIMFTDVPAWWNLHRRDRMFYSGFGRGDHARIMMSAALLCLENSAEAEAIDAYFPDIEAYILSLRPPRYEEIAKRPIDTARSGRGRQVFVNNCTRCHGDAESGIDPQPGVSADEVGTDPAYALSSSDQGAGALAYYFDWFNRSWYGTHGSAGRLERSATPVYSPPPLGESGRPRPTSTTARSPRSMRCSTRACGRRSSGARSSPGTTTSSGLDGRTRRSPPKATTSRCTTRRGPRIATRDTRLRRAFRPKNGATCSST